MESTGLVENFNLNLQAPEESIESRLGVNKKSITKGKLKRKCLLWSE